MKNTAILIALLILAFTVSAQKLHYDKSATLEEIKSNGYSYTQDPDNPNLYWYKRFDQYGECNVQLTFDNSILRKVVMVHLNPTETLARLKDVYAKATTEEAETFDPPSNGYGKGIASNTPYYTGKARYECSNNYTTKDYLFTIIPLNSEVSSTQRNSQVNTTVSKQPVITLISGDEYYALVNVSDNSTCGYFNPNSQLTLGDGKLNTWYNFAIYKIRTNGQAVYWMPLNIQLTRSVKVYVNKKGVTMTYEQ